MNSFAIAFAIIAVGKFRKKIANVQSIFGERMLCVVFLLSFFFFSFRLFSSFILIKMLLCTFPLYIYCHLMLIAKFFLVSNEEELAKKTRESKAEREKKSHNEMTNEKEADFWFLIYANKRYISVFLPLLQKFLWAIVALGSACITFIILMISDRNTWQGHKLWGVSCCFVSSFCAYFAFFLFERWLSNEFSSFI